MTTIDLHIAEQKMFIQKTIYILPDRKYGNMFMVVIRQSGGEHDSI
jgi:hypothetical protein